MAEEIITPNEPEEGEKKFSQSELDAIISKRLGEERKKYPTAERLAAFSKWEEEQQTSAEKITTLTTERDSANNRLSAVNAELEQLKHERFLIDKGVNADDLEFFDFKIKKSVSDEKTYEQAAEEFLKVRKPSGKMRVDMGGSLGGGNPGKTPNGIMNDLIRRR